jgi:integrase/recombinase XerD
MEPLLAANSISQRSLHDLSSPTDDRGHASAEPRTQHATIVCGTSLAIRAPFQQVPGTVGPEEIRAYQVYLTNEKKLTPSSVVTAVSALRFVYKVTLKKAWRFEEVIPAPKMPEKLPVVLSPEEVLQFLGCITNIKHRSILTTCYAAGLRISEAVCLKTSDIDSQRMVIRVEQGKGGRDRYVMLSPALLEILRTWWRVKRPHHWLFPGDIPGHHISTGAVGDACRNARKISVFASPSLPIHYAMDSQSICWNPARMFELFNSCSAIAAWRLLLDTCELPPARSAPPQVRWTCSLNQ